MISSRTLLPFSSPQYILPDIHTKILCNNDNDFCRQLLTTTTFCCCVTVTPFGFDISIFEFSRHFILTSTMNLTGQSTSNSFKPQKLNLEPFRILQKSQTLNPQVGVQLSTIYLAKYVYYILYNRLKSISTISKLSHSPTYSLLKKKFTIGNQMPNFKIIFSPSKKNYRWMFCCSPLNDTFKI